MGCIVPCSKKFFCRFMCPSNGFFTILGIALNSPKQSFLFKKIQFLQNLIKHKMELILGRSLLRTILAQQYISTLLRMNTLTNQYQPPQRVAVDGQLFRMIITYTTIIQPFQYVQLISHAIQYLGEDTCTRPAQTTHGFVGSSQDYGDGVHIPFYHSNTMAFFKGQDQPSSVEVCIFFWCVSLKLYSSNKHS